ncbi:protein RodZ, contains Xre-like HTH and DUF4115 domains [Streptosporangium canum]|uniref:Protein RodZ, contains Xre-like HTH and DUF4115 domains n=1 Tax=Streptosporangium canum TaxID=324952 RepID=A0A1I3UPX5_9ACTN|nr:protein RodZ, contains Xre-like HTH and DUF4115 domains [Streptosporangium canum]
MTASNNPPSPSGPPSGPPPGQQPPKGGEPRPRRVRTAREFNAQLVSLRTSKGLTLEELNKRSAGRLPKSTVSNNLNKNTLPARDFVKRYVRACEVDDDEAARWLSAWQTLSRPPAPAPWRRLVAAFAGTPRTLRGSLPRGSLLAVIMAVVLIAVIVWWRENPAPPTAPAASAQHCNTANQNLITAANGECVGVTDGSDGTDLFGPALRPVMAKIAAANKQAVKTGRYVTIAFLGPLTSAPDGGQDFTGGRAAHELEGAFIAQKTANDSRNSLKVRLVLANEGSDETSWESTVETLKTMVGAPHHLVAVAGLGLSQQESVDAARLLAKPPAIPMVADIITADGFDATGTIDGKDKIPGLARVAPNVSDQLRAISKELAERYRLRNGTADDQPSAALVRSEVTFNGAPDLYTTSMANAFKNEDLGLARYLKKANLNFGFNPKATNTAALLKSISDGLCGKSIPDMVFYAGRATYLPDFLDLLKKRSCHRTKITVVTGSDAAVLPADLLAPDDEAPIEVIYVPLADPKHLDSQDNPDRGLYTDFKDAFTKERFPVAHLDTGWAIMAHDAVVTLTTILGKAANDPRTGKEIMPTADDVSAGLTILSSTNVISGASGIFNIHPETGNRSSTRELKPVHRP